MKRFLFFLVLATSLALTSCQFDDSDIWEKLNEHEQTIKDHEQRISALEELCKQMNTNISSLQTIIEALQNNDYVTSIAPVVKDGETIGYTITFTKSGAITIYHGEDGKDGQNGTDGKDGTTPVIGVKKASDGIYYWTLNGEWLLDNDGNKIKAVGVDGKDGADGSDGADGENGQPGANGTDGKDGITPQLKIENDYWYVSYDNGATWVQLGPATGEEGPQGPQGEQGEPGIGGDSMFTNIDYSNENYVLFTLSNGTQIQVPTWHAFEQLQTLCNQMNTNISALQTIVTALQNNDYVQSITPLMENGKEVGYTILFSKSGTITIYHGKDGENGSDGENGANGQDGKDGYTPQIGVKQDEDGVYYWTLDGEWLLDESGNKVKAVGTDGKDGQNGADGSNGNDGEDGKDGQDGKDGKDGITPQLKIEEDYWYISYDNGTTWTKLGKATGEDGKNGIDGANGSDGKDGGVIIAVHDTQTEVIFILFDGSSIVIPKSSGSTENNDDEHIYFSDPTVESICLAHWDADENGKISYIEAKDVYEMSWHFGNNEEIYSFTELQYFTNLSEVSFIGCTNLRSVVLPESVTSVCFVACYNLMKFNIPEMVSYLDMRECRQITSVVIPVNTSEFYFQNCFNLESVVLTDGLTTIPELAFMACWDLTSISIPESISSIGASAFRDCGGLRNVYCKSVTPPACGEKVFCDYDGNPLDYCIIYVPTASVEAYKSAEGWKEYADNIVGYDF